MPIITINFKNCILVFKKKINQISSKSFLLNKRYIHRFEIFSNQFFKAGFACKFSIARKRAKFIISVTRNSPEFLSACGAFFNDGRAATFLRTINALISSFRCQKIFSTSCAFYFVLRFFSTIPATYRIPICYSLRNLKGLSTHLAYLLYRCIFFLTFATTKFSAPIVSGFGFLYKRRRKIKFNITVQAFKVFALPFFLWLGKFNFLVSLRHIFLQLHYITVSRP